MTAYQTLFVAGDTAPDLTGTLTSGTTPADLSGATIALHLTRPDKTVITRAATIVTATAGTWRYTWQAAELVPGMWSVEAEVTYAGGAVQTFPAASQAYFHVRAQAA
jgi:hypothetical protein